MSKKYKVKRTPKQTTKEKVKKINWRLWGITIAVTLVLFAVYQAGIYFESIAVMYIYAILMGVLIIVYGILNRGFSGFDPEKVSFPKNMAEEEKQILIEKELKRRKKAKIVLIPLIGIMVTLAFDTLYLYYLEPLFKG